MAAALEGIRIVDWTLWRVGPLATCMLADLGADVIHIEERGRGDSLRGIILSGGEPTRARGIHMHFEEHDHSKRSLAVDLKNPKGREILYRLTEKSDVFVTNFRQRVAEKLGLDYQTLRRYNPRLIYASASCYGPRGPEANSPGLELTAWARCGAMMASGEEGMPPICLPMGTGDAAGAIFLAFAIVTALLAREKHGIAQEVHASQLSSMMKLESWTIQSTAIRGVEYPRYRREAIRNPLYNYYQCKNGEWIVLGLIEGERHWPTLCKVMRMPELEMDPRFDSEEKRAKNCVELIALLDSVFATRTVEEWLKDLGEADLIASKVNRIIDLLSDPQVIENQYITEYDHPIAGRIKVMGYPVHFSETPPVYKSPAPELGQHTEEVLLDICGYKWEDISQLKEQGVI